MKYKLTGASASPDTGLLKKEAGEYTFLQNIRGWGGRTAKRTGVQFSASVTNVMGIFDLQNDGDPTSLDKILVVDGDGDLVLYDYSELVTIFDYLFSTGITLSLQSSDLNWWDITPNTTTGVISPTVVTAPASTRSTDLSISQSQTFGFIDSTGIWRLQVDSLDGTVYTTRYATATSTNSFTTNLGFATGVGPVFQDELLTRWRLTVSTAGQLTATAI